MKQKVTGQSNDREKKKKNETTFNISKYKLLS